MAEEVPALVAEWVAEWVARWVAEEVPVLVAEWVANCDHIAMLSLTFNILMLMGHFQDYTLISYFFVKASLFSFSYFKGSVLTINS